ncbi:hypothetical protein [Mesorhizobium sp. M0859]|uniref:hypothetical protein n=1 Tax=Mesorhizobium sp. M0859 TaxID=2957014 RepID=UPI00333BC7F4
MRAVLIGMAILAATSAYGFEAYQLRDDEIDLVKAAFSAALKDPDSAKFGKFSAAMKDDQTIIVCGTVNSKNSFGGYSGAAPFVGEINTDSHSFEVQKLAQTDAEMAQVLVRCQNAGAMPAL